MSDYETAAELRGASPQEEKKEAPATSSAHSTRSEQERTGSRKDKDGRSQETSAQFKQPVRTDIHELIDLGKTLGLSGTELREFIKEQQDREREERVRYRETIREQLQHEQEAAEAERQERAAEAVRQMQKLRYEHEFALEQLRLTLSDSKNTSFNRSVDVPSERQQLQLKVPKFENKQLGKVAKYLNMFEGVMKQNGVQYERWPLRYELR